MKILLLLLGIHLASGSQTHPSCAKPNLAEEMQSTLLNQCSSSDHNDEDAETECYDELGCFPNNFPWVSVLRPFPPPFPPSEVNVQIYCYTRESTERHTITLWPKIDLGGCPLTKENLKVAFITHGFIQNANLTWLSEMKDNYLKAIEAVVFLVDWGKGAEVLSYLQGASNTRIAGAEIARFLKFLEANNQVKFSRVQLIGHSLGAHVMSYAAKGVGGKIGHFTALDPAQPGFEGTDKEVRVDRTDAEYVEVVHTNAAPFIPTLGFGMISPVGDTDFYVNGGAFQPGCPLPEHLPTIESIADLASIPAQALYQLVFCSHTKAYEYYSNVFDDSCTIVGRKAWLVQDPTHIHKEFGLIDKLWSGEYCNVDKCVTMGLHSREFAGRGPLHTITSPLPPYCDPKTSYKLIKKLSEKIETPKDSPLYDIMDAFNKRAERDDGLKTFKVPRPVVE